MLRYKKNYFRCIDLAFKQIQEEKGDVELSRPSYFFFENENDKKLTNFINKKFGLLK